MQVRKEAHSGLKASFQQHFRNNKAVSATDICSVLCLLNPTYASLITSAYIIKNLGMGNACVQTVLFTFADFVDILPSQHGTTSNAPVLYFIYFL